MMEYQELHKFDDMNWFDRSMEVYKMLTTSEDQAKVAALIVAILIIGVVLVMLMKPLGRWWKSLLIYVPIAFLVCIVTLFLYSWYVSHQNVGVGYYEANIKPDKVETVQNIGKGYKSIIRIQDDKNKSVKLEYQGKKIKNNDNVQVRTRDMIVNKDDPRKIDFDIESENAYQIIYNGKEMKSSGVDAFFSNLSK